MLARTYIRVSRLSLVFNTTTFSCGVSMSIRHDHRSHAVGRSGASCPGRLYTATYEHAQQSRSRSAQGQAWRAKKSVRIRGIKIGCSRVMSWGDGFIRSVPADYVQLFFQLVSSFSFFFFASDSPLFMASPFSTHRRKEPE